MSPTQMNRQLAELHAEGTVDVVLAALAVRRVLATSNAYLGPTPHAPPPRPPAGP